MNEELYKEIDITLKETMHMNVETLARLMLLCELLIEKGYLKDDEVMKKLSQNEIDRLLSESED